MFGPQDQGGFSFDNLNLGGVKASMAVVVLPPGTYICTTADAKLENTKAGDGSKRLMVRLVDEGGAGVITEGLNVYSAKSKDATRIGKEQLKGLLVAGGHPDPDNVGAHGIASVNGLRVGVRVSSEMYEGEKRSRVSGFMEPSKVTAPGASDKPAPKAAAAALGSGSIPF